MICARMASSWFWLSRNTARDAVRICISVASRAPTDFGEVTLSTKISPLDLTACKTARITRSSAVALDPSWLFRPMAPGT